VHERLKPHTCDVCAKQFADPSSMKIHVRKVHKKARDHECETCGERFRLDKDLQYHVRSVHERLKLLREQAENRWAEIEKWQAKRRQTVAAEARRLIARHGCAECPARFGSPSDLAEHVQSAHDKRSDHACEECGAQFARAGNLRRHRTMQHSRLP